MLSEIIIPEKIEKINEYTFYNCNISKIHIPEGIKTIGKQAFGSCSVLNDIKISDTVTTIEDEAFSRCYALTEITLPPKLEVLGLNIFYECNKLTTLEIPASVIKTGRRLANACSKLTTVKLRGDIENISHQEFENAFAVKNVIFTEGSISIKRFGFESSVKNITIPDTVKKIYANAFIDCTNLTEINIPEGVETIGAGAFVNSSEIRSVKIPESVTEISKNSFHESTVWIVYENSTAHQVAKNIGSVLYCVIRKTLNPEIAYGSGIEGVVTYSDGTVASDVDVEIIYDDGEIKQSAETDENGVYKFDYAEVGRYTIKATDDENRTDSETLSVKRMNVFDVYLAGETNLVLKNSYSVSGAVSSDSAKLTLSDTKGNVIKTLETSDGLFEFNNIPQGSYLVKAENETGSTVTEIYVSNADVTDINLEIKPQSASILGYVKVEKRDGTLTPRVWINIDLIDSDGNVIAHTTTDADGKYMFDNIPLGKYNLVAITNEMRPDISGKFDKSFELKGYASVDVTEYTEYTADTIILREDKVNATTVTGKVTANGETQDCEVILTNENGDEIAIYKTANDGKFEFVNIPDGMYLITAITNKDGVGFEVITITNGKGFEGLHIKVAKADKISKREETLLKIPDCSTKTEAEFYKNVIVPEKEFYDSLSEKERKQLSKDWVEKLFLLWDLLSESDVEIIGDVSVENVESVVDADEIDKEIKFTLTVAETEANEAGEDGINTEEEYENEKIKEKKGKNKNIAKYYDITFSKDGENISNIRKQTETNGKLRITMEIPEEYKGHKQYTFIHMHKGEAVTLIDLDDNPDTVTFEIDKFSTFALAYSDVSHTKTPYPATMIYDEMTGKLTAVSTERGYLYVAEFNGDKTFNKVKIYPVGANEEIKVEFSQNKKAFLWNENYRPLCMPFTIE